MYQQLMYLMPTRILFIASRLMPLNWIFYEAKQQNSMSPELPNLHGFKF